MRVDTRAVVLSFRNVLISTDEIRFISMSFLIRSHPFASSHILSCPLNSSHFLSLSLATPLSLSPLHQGSGIKEIFSFTLKFLFSKERGEVLDAHNLYRCMHGAPALRWDAAVAENAQAWAAGGMQEHSPAFRRKIGGVQHGDGRARVEEGEHRHACGL